MNTSTWQFSSEKYNQLPMLHDADSRLVHHKLELESFIACASKVLAAHGMGDGRLGAFLLHRHWDHEPNAVMLESVGTLKSGRKALITCSFNSGITMPRFPARWSCLPTAPYVNALEFSSDPAVEQVFTEFVTDHDVLEEVTGLVFEHKLQDLIGLTVCPRHNLHFSMGQQLVEENFEDMSVVTAQALTKEDQDTAIQTGWPLFIKTPGAPLTACKAYCVHGPGQSCRHHTHIPDPPICRPSGCV